MDGPLKPKKQRKNPHAKAKVKGPRCRPARSSVMEVVPHANAVSLQAEYGTATGYGVGEETVTANGPLDQKSVTALRGIKSLCPTQQLRYFEWFTHRTVIKLPGLFGSSFWDTLLFQACSNEPAVLHAVIALSSA
ncbi:hypothetical protein ACEPPN_010984 [Leptodophora sp. 'Broadleaf-Isolate-01']